jgi:hypothetical protein
MQRLKASCSARSLITALSRLLYLLSWWKSKVRGGWKPHENLKLRTLKHLTASKQPAETILLESLNEIIFRVWSSGSCGPGSSVGIATGYGLDGPGIESRWGRDFPHLSRPTLGPIQPPVQCVPGLSRGVESGRGVTLTPHPFYWQGLKTE